MLGRGGIEQSETLMEFMKLPYPVLADPGRAVYRGFGLDKVLFVIQRSAVVLVDKQDLIRYIHRSTNPYETLNEDELDREIEKLNTVV